MQKGTEAKPKLSTEPYKGVRDFYPEDMAVQNYIFDVWKKTAESFGYLEYTASILEPAELYEVKSNEEIVNEQMFTFTDRGGRRVALRPEMTPTLARMVAARRKSLKFPLRWFSIPNVFRYEKPQRGRKREHWQLNCDIMGVAGMEADIEIISLAHAVMKAFGAKEKDFIIKVSNRKKMENALLANGIVKENVLAIFRLLDKKGKMPEEERLSELEKLGYGKNIDISTWAHDAENLKKKGITNIEFDSSIVRGFDYYTGMVFEVFDTHRDNRRSLFGGGRYDNLLEIFGVEPVPTVGFGMGDVTIRDFLETHELPLCEN